MNSNMNTLEDKIMSAFAGKVVRKDLAFAVKGGLPVPTYVLEYLLGQYCATNDEAQIHEGLEKVKDIIRNNYINRAEAEVTKGKIKELGKFSIIDKISATLNEKQDCYEATFANLGLSRVPLASNIVTQNPKLLSGNGVWCIVTIGYLEGEDVLTRWDIRMLKPIQISNITLADYVDKRHLFTTDEWIDFLIQTVGLNPEALNRREKFITLARLMPHVENNFNFMELGPKGTGKSHVFQELSPYGVLVSVGDVTSARLFVKMAGNREILGLVGYWDVVAWDEFEQQKGRAVDAVLIDTMQNYLANKSFNRGKGTHEASASMSFVGNTKHTVSYMLKNSHLFESIPTSFIKGAFLDRIHLYNPGWEIKMLKKSSFSNGYGLITDYIAAILHELRNLDWTARLEEYAKFDGSLSERDHLAIRKTFSGMAKLLYPDGEMTNEEAYELIDFAAECRKRVKDQLYKIDETFHAEPAHFEYTMLKAGGKTMVINTLECIEEGINTTPAKRTEEPVAATVAATVVATATPTAAPAPQLMAKSVDIRENQKGISYKKLFGEYLRSTKNITVIDPFIRLPYQVYNFIEFVQMCREVCNEPESLSITLSTQNDDEHIPEMIDTFDDLQAELAALGIEFNYNFEADHDRFIKLDNGWRISLGRGLDIFEPIAKFSLASASQENRRCKPFSVTYIKEN